MLQPRHAGHFLVKSTQDKPRDAILPGRPKPCYPTVGSRGYKIRSEFGVLRFRRSGSLNTTKPVITRRLDSLILPIGSIVVPFRGYLMGS